MPPIPALPTDNLYKFLTFFGLALVLVPYYLGQDIDEKYVSAFSNSMNTMQNFNMILNEQQFEIAQMDMYTLALDYPVRAKRLDAIDSALDGYKSLLPVYKNLIIQRLSFVDTSLGQVRAEIKSLLKRTENTQTKRDTIEVKPETENTKFENVALTKQEIEAMSIYMYLLGFVLMIGGFILWFWRYQRFQDTILREQAKEAAKKNKPTVQQ